MILPRGYPPTPKARSRPMEPVGMTSTFSTFSSPMRMMEPLPKSFSIFVIAACKAFILACFSAFSCSACLSVWLAAACSSVFAINSQFYNSMSLSNSSCHGKPCLPSSSRNGSGSNSSTLNTPAFFQMPFKNIIAPVMAGTPVV